MMPAGKYYIGDLCYVLDAVWDEFCNITIGGNDLLDGEFTLPDGRRFASYGTAYGDGIYSDQLGNRYGVDAGLIGCILVDDLSEADKAEATKCGAVIEFSEPFATYVENGTIVFGEVRIPTGDEEEEEDEDEEEYLYRESRFGRIDDEFSDDEEG